MLGTDSVDMRYARFEPALPRELGRHNPPATCQCLPGCAKRFDRCGISLAGAVPSAAITIRAPAQVAAAADCRGDHVAAAWGAGAALANAAAVLSSGLDGETLVLPVA